MDAIPRIFVSYSHHDTQYKDELLKRLKIISRQAEIDAWDDGQLLAGDTIDSAIRVQLDSADIVCMLISPDFIASDYCYSQEMKQAMANAEQRHTRIVAIIIRDTPDWRDYVFGHLLALPSDGKPIEDWPSADKFWAQVQIGLKRVIEARSSKAKKSNVNQPSVQSVQVEKVKQDKSSSSSMPKKLFSRMGGVLAVLTIVYLLVPDKYKFASSNQTSSLPKALQGESEVQNSSAQLSIPETNPVDSVQNKYKPKKSSIIKDLSFEPEMIKISGGTFNMGSSDIEKEREDDERLHTVQVDDFWMGKTEITFAQYDVFAEVTGRNKPDDQEWGRGSRPVINISWYDAVAYAAWLKKETGKPYRLPTEAEWEYAARAGTSTQYSWGDVVGRNIANCIGCGSQWDGKQTAPVGSFSPNNWGLYDMHGNVWEWTCSGYDETYGGSEQRCVSSDAGDDRVLRGGSWIGNMNPARSASRFRDVPFGHYISMGFRLARGSN